MIFEKCEIEYSEGINNRKTYKLKTTIRYVPTAGDFEKLILMKDYFTREFASIEGDDELLRVQNKRGVLDDEGFRLEFSVQYHEKEQENESIMKTMKKREEN